MNLRNLFSVFSILLLTACGGGGGEGTSAPTPTPTPAPTPAPTPSVSLSSNLTEIDATNQIRLTWDSYGVNNCLAGIVADGGSMGTGYYELFNISEWSGPKNSSGTEDLVINYSGIYDFGLRCSIENDEDQFLEATQRVIVNQLGVRTDTDLEPVNYPNDSASYCYRYWTDKYNYRGGETQGLNDNCEIKINENEIFYADIINNDNDSLNSEIDMRIEYSDFCLRARDTDSGNFVCVSAFIGNQNDIEEKWNPFINLFYGNVDGSDIVLGEGNWTFDSSDPSKLISNIIIPTGSKLLILDHEIFSENSSKLIIRGGSLEILNSRMQNIIIQIDYLDDSNLGVLDIQGSSLINVDIAEISDEESNRAHFKFYRNWLENVNKGLSKTDKLNFNYPAHIFFIENVMYNSANIELSFVSPYFEGESVQNKKIIPDEDIFNSFDLPCDYTNRFTNQACAPSGDNNKHRPIISGNIFVSSEISPPDCDGYEVYICTRDMLVKLWEEMPDKTTLKYHPSIEKNAFTQNISGVLAFSSNIVDISKVLSFGPLVGSAVNQNICQKKYFMEDDGPFVDLDDADGLSCTYENIIVGLNPSWDYFRPRLYFDDQRIVSDVKPVFRTSLYDCSRTPDICNNWQTKWEYSLFVRDYGNSYYPPPYKLKIIDILEANN